MLAAISSIVHDTESYMPTVADVDDMLKVLKPHDRATCLLALSLQCYDMKRQRLFYVNLPDVIRSPDYEHLLHAHYGGNVRAMLTSVVGHSSFLYLANNRRHVENWAPKMASFILRLLSRALAAFYVKFIMQWYLPLELCRY